VLLVLVMLAEHRDVGAETSRTRVMLAEHRDVMADTPRTRGGGTPGGKPAEEEPRRLRSPGGQAAVTRGRRAGRGGPAAL